MDGVRPVETWADEDAPTAGDAPVSEAEVKLAAYRYTSRITDAAWEPSRVLGRIGPVETFLAAAAENRWMFDLACAALEEQTINLGLHPMIRNPAVEKHGLTMDTGQMPDLPHPAALVKAAERILRYACR